LEEDGEDEEEGLQRHAWETLTNSKLREESTIVATILTSGQDSLHLSLPTNYIFAK